jgi:hypothetical protein
LTCLSKFDPVPGSHFPDGTGTPRDEIPATLDATHAICPPQAPYPLLAGVSHTACVHDATPQCVHGPGGALGTGGIATSGSAGGEGGENGMLVSAGRAAAEAWQVELVAGLVAVAALARRMARTRAWWPAPQHTGRPRQLTKDLRRWMPPTRSANRKARCRCLPVTPKRLACTTRCCNLSTGLWTRAAHSEVRLLDMRRLRAGAGTTSEKAWKTWRASLRRPYGPRRDAPGVATHVWCSPRRGRKVNLAVDWVQRRSVATARTGTLNCLARAPRRRRRTTHHANGRLSLRSEVKE